MFADSKNTIIKILLLYLGTSAIFLFNGFYHLNIKETENIIFVQMASLRDIAFDINNYLRSNNDLSNAIPEILQNINVPFAIYDRNDNLIFSNLSVLPDLDGIKRGFYSADGKIIANPFFVPHRDREHKRKPPPFPYKIFIEDSSLDSQILIMRLKLGGYFILVFALMGIVATILVRMFLKPINEYIKALDTFIKDTTHEINTPLSVILTSIETLKKDSFDIEEQKKLERIKLASLQLSQIYSDLVAHNFPHSIQSPAVELSLDSILKERLDFFIPFFTQKKLRINSDIQNVSFKGSKEKFILLFDNLLSNAIKYNSKGGSIDISLEQGRFTLKDSGRGIKIKDLNKIYERYARFSADSGGFGIGLFIVKKICDEYNINIDVNTSQEGTIFTLRWK